MRTAHKTSAWRPLFKVVRSWPGIKRNRSSATGFGQLPDAFPLWLSTPFRTWPRSAVDYHNSRCHDDHAFIRTPCSNTSRRITDQTEEWQPRKDCVAVYQPNKRNNDLQVLSPANKYPRLGPSRSLFIVMTEGMQSSCSSIEIYGVLEHKLSINT